MALGEAHCLMLLTDNTLLVMGSNEYGQIGLKHSVENYFIESLIQVELEGLTPKVDVSY